MNPNNPNFRTAEDWEKLSNEAHEKLRAAQSRIATLEQELSGFGVSEEMLKLRVAELESQLKRGAIGKHLARIAALEAGLREARKQMDGECACKWNESDFYNKGAELQITRKCFYCKGREFIDNLLNPARNPKEGA